MYTTLMLCIPHDSYSHRDGRDDGIGSIKKVGPIYFARLLEYVNIIRIYG